MQDDPDRKRKVAIKESDVDIYSKYANAEIESERIKKLNVVYSPGTSLNLEIPLTKMTTRK